MASSALIESRKIPADTAKTAGVVLSEKKWVALVGLVGSGTATREAAKKLGITRGQLEGAIRADAKRKQVWEEVKTAALRRQWDHETVDEVLTQIAMNENGGYLKGIIENMGLDPHSFYVLMMRDDEVRAQYEQARQIQAEIQADEMRQISDNGANDSYIDDRGKVRVDHDVLGRSKLRVDTLKWTMSKLHYKRFGDKIQQDQNINLVVDHAERLANARKRVETMRDITPSD